MNTPRTASLVLLSLLAGCADPSVLVTSAQPIRLGGEIVVDTSVRPHISVTATLPAAVVSNGSIFLVVWRDTRNGGNGEVWATRVSSTGEQLDPGGFRIGAQGAYASTPVVASDGRDFLIAWTGSIARVSAAGAVLSVEASDLGTRAGVPSPDAPWSLAWDGANYWTAFSPGAVYVQRLDAAGHTRGAPLAVASTGTRPVIAATAAGATVVWDDETARDIRMARVSSAGVLLDATPQPVTAVGAQRVGPSIATDGTNYFIAWTARMPSGSRLAGGFGALFNASGAPAGVAGVQYFADSLPGPLNYRASVSYNGANFVVAHAAMGRQVVSRVDRTGAWISTSASSTALPDELRASASSSTASVVVSGYHAAMYSAAGAPLTDFDAITVGDAHSRPRVAALGDDFMVTWHDKTGADLGGVRAARISSAGVVLDAPSLALAERAVWPGVSSDGAQWVLGWLSTTIGEPGGISLLRVTADGARVGAPSMTARNVGGRLAAFGGGVHLAVGAQIPGATVSNAVMRLRSDGTMVDPLPIAAPVSTMDPDFSAAAYDGRNFLVAYTRASVCSIGAVRIDPSGDLIDASPIRLACSTVGGRIDVAFDGTNYLVAWDENGPSTGMSYGAINMVRVRADGTVLDPTPRRLSSASTLQRSPVLGYDGRSFVAAWIDTSRGAGDVVGARIASDGTVLDATPFPIAASALAEDDPALAVNRRGQVLVAYSLYDARLAARRLRARLVTYADDAPFDAGAVDAPLPDAALPSDVVASPDAAALPDVVASPDAASSPDVAPPSDAVASTDAVATLDGADAPPLDAAAPADDAAQPDVFATDVSRSDARAADVALAADADDAGTTPPAPEGGLCDVRGRAGANTTGGAGVLALLTLARRRRRR